MHREVNCSSGLTAHDSRSVIAPSTVRDFIALLKPGVMSLVVFTGLAGMVLAPGHISLFQQMLTLACIALASGAGAAINMWYDRDIDSIMTRTSKRPVPAGRVAPDDALAFGLFLSALSVMLMGLALNWIAAGLLGFAIFFYAVVYTMWLKRSTAQNIVIGGAAGAFPPVIGWAAVAGDISAMPIVLFLIIFLWTPPHFWALALYKNSDYARAGIPMMPVVVGSKRTKQLMVAYTWMLMACSLSLPLLGMSGAIYGFAALFLNLGFLYHVYRVLRDSTNKWAKKTFGFSILYLFVLFSMMIIDGWLAPFMHI